MPRTLRDRLDDILPATTFSAEETLALGSEVAGALVPGDILALHGDLGSGKTHFVKGIARGLGLDPNDVVSPTFVLVQSYETDEFTLVHADAYRITGSSEMARVGLEEYLSDPAMVCVIEWPERVEDLLPDDTCRLLLQAAGQTSRHIAVMDPAEAASRSD
ncbi:tRNA (adenosine(37)-N6)-threonylcarbamoyltransferase complex ATPase subunit type 1 TsaE [soil metagenome]